VEALTKQNGVRLFGKLKKKLKPTYPTRRNRKPTYFFLALVILILVNLVKFQCLRDTKTLLHGTKVQEMENTNHEEIDLFLKYVINDTALKNILSRWRVSIQE
jgi:hypothetical protein